ncbi:hypothetical protein TRIUR3_23530 [Triticum urartu]|uniref:Uncharacterized protein n=1 Tax=Triticum urartu TaxID=4572 RepID=M7ZPL1_TRIUA|nr:hypothetical protein TRIUR3_23530 [Triticum urartu]
MGVGPTTRQCHQVSCSTFWAHRGVMDYIKHALTLFTDFTAGLIIMLKNTCDNSEDKKKRRRRS